MASKPTKQQIAQAKARAGGNDPIKVTNAGLKRLGNATLQAGLLALPISPKKYIAGARIVGGIVGKGAKRVTKTFKNAGVVSTLGMAEQQKKKVGK
jgi:hypothetical protein